jgi:4-amino-4-deoxy-L-arabinose transferase-like glycosyltransferase
MEKISHLNLSKYLKMGLVFIVTLLLLLRFINLNADFPSGITNSYLLFTDEGFYSKSAVRNYLTGAWFQGGQTDVFVVIPIGQILHRISFALFGLSASSARITIIFSFTLIVLTTALLIRRYFGDYPAILTALLLTSNYIGFVYSRLATMDFVALSFAMASLFFAGGVKSKNKILNLAIASLVLGLGILSKPHVIFVAPLLAFLIWRAGASNNKERAVFFIISGAVLFITVLGYHLITKSLFPDEYAFYDSITVGRMLDTFQEWQQRLTWRIPRHTIKNLGQSLVWLTMSLTSIAFVLSKRFRRNPLTILLFCYLIAYTFTLSLSSYLPPRYYLPLLIPFAGLCATACFTLSEFLRETRYPVTAILPLILVAIISFLGIWDIGSYLATPSYSLYQMSHDVKDIIQKREGIVQGVQLFGNISENVSLEIGTIAFRGKPDLDYLDMNDYHSEYWIMLTEKDDVFTPYEMANVSELGSWYVLDKNYPGIDPVRLYFVEWPSESIN